MRLRLLLLPLLFIIYSCQGQKDKGSLSPDDYAQAIKAPGIQLLDVRTAGEYRNGHLAGALQANWNNSAEFRERVQALDKSRPVYVYCASGARSAAAAQWMKQAGFSEVHNLDGGIIAWNAQGKPLEGMPAAKPMSDEEFQKKIASGTVLVDVGASWCPPCKKMEPVIAGLEKELAGRFSLHKVDAGVETALLKKLGVDKIPTFIVYKDGKEIWRVQGVVDQATLRQHLVP